MNRRDFLLLRSDRGKEVLELSCERLYRCCLGTGLRGASHDEAPEPGEDGEPLPPLDEPKTRHLFRNLDRVLQGVDVLRIMDSEWLSDGRMGVEFEALLESFRARGGRIELSTAFAQRSAPH